MAKFNRHLANLGAKQTRESWQGTELRGAFVADLNPRKDEDTDVLCHPDGTVTFAKDSDTLKEAIAEADDWEVMLGMFLSPKQTKVY